MITFSLATALSPSYFLPTFIFTSSHRISANAFTLYRAEKSKVIYWLCFFVFFFGQHELLLLLPCKKNHNSISSIPSIFRRVKYVVIHNEKKSGFALIILWSRFVIGWRYNRTFQIKPIQMYTDRMDFNWVTKASTFCVPLGVWVCV